VWQAGLKCLPGGAVVGYNMVGPKRASERPDNTAGGELGNGDGRYATLGINQWAVMQVIHARVTVASFLGAVRASVTACAAFLASRRQGRCCPPVLQY